jgi:hypothetical protein
MEKSQGAIERGLHTGSAGRLHVRFPNTFRAVAVLGELTRGAKRRDQGRGYASTDVAPQHTSAIPIDGGHSGFIVDFYELFFSPAIHAIPDSGPLTNLGRHQMNLFDDKVLRFTVAPVVLNSELQVEAAFHVLHGRLAQ